MKILHDVNVDREVIAKFTYITKIANFRKCNDGFI